MDSINQNEKSIETLRLIQVQEFIPKNERKAFFTELLEQANFSQREIVIFGKKTLQPRLIDYQADPRAVYKYSNSFLHPSPWTNRTKDLRQRLKDQFGLDFNSVLLNYYRDGKDSMGFHSDDEKELGPNPVIASVSFGTNRPLLFEPRKELVAQKFSISQPDGSLLIMAGSTQKFWKHGLSKSPSRGPRINLTFRNILNS